MLLLLSSSRVQAQSDARQLTARFIEQAITLDGRLDEAGWETAEQADDFWQFFPTDTLKAATATEVKILYDDRNLYVGITAWSTGPDYVVSTLRRDFGGTTNDNVSLLFDTFSDGTTAFFFGVTPYGVRREGLVSEGGASFENTWDIKWQAEAQRYDDHYVVELVIPFTSLKFREGTTQFRFRTYRWNLQTNEQSTWVRVPQNQIFSSLAFMGQLKFERPLGQSRTPFAIIPYVNGLAQKSYPSDAASSQVKIGADAKLAVGNSMNLDLTVNPDFSNVEVDDIFTNLTRFEVQLPERRQFFIDNNDLFNSFGSNYRDASPFFSRRIGLARDTAGNLIENQILAGARLSGKLDENWRLGVLNIQTAEDIPNQIASNNNMMLALQRKVFSRSNISAFFINRETFQDYEFQSANDRFNRVLGLEYNLASADNVWSGKAYVHKSIQPDDTQGNLSAQATVTYNTRLLNLITDWVYVDDGFRSDLGFIPRTDIIKAGNGIGRTFWPKAGPLNRYTFRLVSLTFWRPSLDYRRTDQELRVQQQLEFRNLSTAEIRYANRLIYLAQPFDPTRTPGAVPLAAGRNYHFNEVLATYATNNTSLFTFTGTTRMGQFFTGSAFSLTGRVGYRVQPWAQFSLALNYDRIRLPNPHADADLWLLTPRFDVTFSRSFFWSTLLQYSKQRDNLGINSRLQWRFAPLSDLFLVYNDNYQASIFEPRFRSINLKMTYWLNL